MPDGFAVALDSFGLATGRRQYMQYSDTLSFWWQGVTTHSVYVEGAEFFLALSFKLPVCLVFDSLVLRSSQRWLSRKKTRSPQTVLLSYNGWFHLSCLL